MWEPTEAMVLTQGKRRQLEQIARNPRTTQKVALRVAIILGAAEGLSKRELARRLATTRPIVLLWRKRFEQAGVEGLLRDAPRPGRHKQIRQATVAKILRLTLEERPREATHWSTRTLAARCGVSHMTVHRIWRAYGLQPHRVERFKVPTDPEFVARVRDIAGLYVNPPERALVLAVDEKSQIQALERTQPILPLRAGLPERQTPKRLAVHLILDNYGTHPHPRGEQWLEAHPRYHFHFTPKGASWLNQVERFFAELTRRRIRRGSFRSVRELERAIRKYVAEHNRHARPYCVDRLGFPNHPQSSPL